MITVEMIHAAADTLNGQGQKPTYDAIRALLGSGSYTTISNGLKTWQPRDIETFGELGSPPPGLMERTEAWAREIWTAASNAAEAIANERLADISATLEKSEASCNEFGLLADRQQQKIEMLEGEVRSRDEQLETLREAAEKRSGELAAAKAEVRTWKSALADLTAAIRVKAKEKSEKDPTGARKAKEKSQRRPAGSPSANSDQASAAA